MSWHSKLILLAVHVYLSLQLFHGFPSSPSLSLSVSIVQQRALRSNPLNNTIQYSYSVALVEYSTLGLKHSIVRAFFLPGSFQCQLHTCSPISFVIPLPYPLGCYPLLLLFALSIYFIPLLSPVLSYFVHSPFQRSSLSLLPLCPLPFP